MMASPPLKVLFLMEDLCYGGTQKQNLALARRLDRDRFQPEILTLTGPTDLDNDVRDIPLHHLGIDRRVAPLFFARLPAHIRRIHPDILLNCTALPNIWGRIWGKFLGVPVIVGTCRGGGAIFRQHEFLLSGLADGMVCNSGELQEKLLHLGYPAERLRLIANGVDTEHFTPGVTRDMQKIVCVARLAKDKDHATLLRAFAGVLEKFPGAVLEIIGEGTEEKALKDLASSLGPKAARQIKFMGPRSDPAPFLKGAGILALSSIREAMPNAILEGMAAGLPICASAVGAIPEIVGDAGLLHAPGDAQALSANICRLLEDPQMAMEMGKRGRGMVVEKYSFAQMVAKHEEFLQWLHREKTAL